MRPHSAGVEEEMHTPLRTYEDGTHPPHLPPLRAREDTGQVEETGKQRFEQDCWLLLAVYTGVIFG